jgi:hypothetical protein
MMKGKKGEMFYYIIGGILAVVICVILLFVFKTSFSKEASTINDNIDRTSSDCDGDGVKDIFDFCCKTKAGSSVGFNGCTGAKDEKSVRCESVPKSECVGYVNQK